MSKSLGNMVFVPDLLETYRPEAIRLYLSGVRYRDVLEWSPGALDEAEELVTLLRSAAEATHPVHDDAHPVETSGDLVDADPFGRRFREVMDDDLDTPRAIATLRELAEAILAGKHAGRPVSQARHELRTLAGVLGVTLPVV
jgi:cysteinyl-tRNA synthetase